MRYHEAKLQEACHLLFKLTFPGKLFIHVPNEGQRSWAMAAALRRQGMVSGVPDILIPEPSFGFPGLWIELKNGKTEVTKNQISMMNELKKRGHAVAVCRSTEEFLQTCKDYFIGKWPKKEGIHE
jgi:hypothetical protein